MDPRINLTFPNQNGMLNISNELKFDWIDKLPIEEHSGIGSIITTPVTSLQIKNSSLSCTTCTFGGKWENRLSYIKKVVSDVVMKCHKAEPLVLISLGAGNLLMEYIIGKALMDHGFQQLSFFLIDPDYAFHDGNKDHFKNLDADFRKLIETEYAKKYNAHMPREQIRFFSRAQNIAKYPINHANVVMLECLPPYGELLKRFKMYKFPNCNSEKLFMGNKFVSAKHANSIAFLPKTCEQAYRNGGTTLSPHSSLPFVGFQDNPQSPIYCIDWGCKIYTDGKFFVKFQGTEGFISGVNLNPKQTIQLDNGKSVTVEKWIPTIQSSIEEYLSAEIASLKQGDAQKKLSQAEKTALLNKVEEIFKKQFFPYLAFYQADYAVDRSEMLEYLSTVAGPNYRKIFTLYTDDENSCTSQEKAF